MKDYQHQLTRLFTAWHGSSPIQMTELAQAGSDRRYFRLFAENGTTAIGTYNADRRENEVFLYFTKHFQAMNLSVPRLYAQNNEQGIYLQEDLGDTQLFNLLPTSEKPFSPELVALYKRTVEKLAELQIKGKEGLDFNRCYPRAAFDKQSMRWDLNYFKHFFLQLAKIPCDEQALEDDFGRLTDYLLLADTSFFLFRDFQSRNIMIKNNEPYFIDYQGGRQGALQYDVASLLYQAKGNLSQAVKNEVFEHYLNTIERLLPYSLDRKFFTELYEGYILIRCLQTLGAYGFRGLYEKREHFITSIPYAVRQLKGLLDTLHLPIKLPELEKCLRYIVNEERFSVINPTDFSQSDLVVKIASFSYKVGIPEDESPNGGGFVFDCRFLNNPGRIEEYKTQTGLDKPVIEYLQQHSDIDDFLKNVFNIVDKAVENYASRNFESLMISFGCTGGRHRSVYSAEKTAKHLKEKYNVKVQLSHCQHEAGVW